LYKFYEKSWEPLNSDFQGRAIQVCKNPKNAGETSNSRKIVEVKKEMLNFIQRIYSRLTPESTYFNAWKSGETTYDGKEIANKGRTCEWEAFEYLGPQG
jgi:hypothetical protein